MFYIGNTQKQFKSMLRSIGVSDFNDLLRDIPKKLFKKREMEIGAPMTEMEIVEYFDQLAAENSDIPLTHKFVGAGVSPHFLPAALKAIMSRSDFSTSYTPYQPEISQGILQALYEYQTMISILTGTDLSNASSYDAATAMAEAIVMAVNYRGERRVMLSPTINPHYLETFRTHNIGPEFEVKTFPHNEYAYDIKAFENELLSKNYACVVVQMPNFFGLLEDIPRIIDIAHNFDALVVVVVDPLTLGLLESPGTIGADIVVGEGQPLGSAMGFGGPLLGFLTAKEELMRFLPGRVIGKTVDEDGRDAFVMTLQAREQHIRREKALFNICTNETLLAIASLVYLALLGPGGLREISNQSVQNAHYAHYKLMQHARFNHAFGERKFFSEFVLRVTTPDLNGFYERVVKRGFIPGIRLDRFGRFDEFLSNSLLLSFTEIHRKDTIDRFVKAMVEELK